MSGESFSGESDPDGNEMSAPWFLDCHSVAPSPRSRLVIFVKTMPRVNAAALNIGAVGRNSVGKHSCTVAFFTRKRIHAQAKTCHGQR
ncbi:MAG: hypothetical protein KGK16_18735, partial [Bradyrhizobium sp.]|nr:hypothetical protein [Bradyrhizobium sp.]